MAKSTGYFGLRHGSTKSHTFQVLGGVQITKDRVEGGKNPRTPQQMRQRMLCATVAQAYKAMSVICNHSFEGVSAGRDSGAKFRELNMKLIAIDVEGNNKMFGYNKWGVKGMMPGSYQLSDGKLPEPCAGEVEVESVNATNKQGVISVCSGLTDAEIIESFGFKQFDDIVTLCVAYPKADGSYGFGAIRFTYKQGEGLADSLVVDKAGDIFAASMQIVTSGSLKTVKVTFTTSFDWDADASISNVYTAAIASQKRNGVWKRSEAYFNVENATPTYAEAFATYPVGEQPFMNGDGGVSGVSAPASSNSGSNSGNSGSTDSGNNGGNSGNSGSQSGQSGDTNTLAAPTISGNTTFSESSQVSISAADGAEIRYTLDGSTPTAESTLYSEAFTVTETTSVKAIAIKDGQTSEVASKTFVKSSGEGGMDQN
jgi:hypothetical protein